MKCRSSYMLNVSNLERRPHVLHTLSVLNVLGLLVSVGSPHVSQRGGTFGEEGSEVDGKVVAPPRKGQQIEVEGVVVDPFVEDPAGND